VTEAAGAAAAETAGATEAMGTTEEAQKPEGAGTQEVRRRMSLEVRQFPTQQIPQELTERGSGDPT
jgi:hypothetical protein